MSEGWSPAQKDRAFDKFWAHWPKERRVKKYLSRQKFERLVTSEETFNKLLAWIAHEKQSEQWRDPRFIPHPTTVLNQRRWEDDQEEQEEIEHIERETWICRHDIPCGNRNTCALVSSKVCPHTPSCAKRTECLERIVSQWR